MTGNQHTNPEVVKTYLKYTVIPMIALYVIYGVFGMVFVGMDDFSEFWQKEVFDLWKTWLLDLSPTSPSP